MKKIERNHARKAHLLDHLVLPTANLDVARSRLNELGFNVAPVGIHPFGTTNACVYFADNTYLEPLAIGHRETAEAASLHGNQFTARDAAYRFRQGVDGFSALVFATPDAGADHLRFTNAGLSGGSILDFGRDFDTRDGKTDRMDFRLAFAADLRSPDFFGITCQRINVPKADRSKLTAHENGVMGIRTVILTEQNPTDFQYFFQELMNEREVDAHSFGMNIQTSSSTISVLTPDGFASKFGVVVERNTRGILGQAIVFEVRDIEELKDLLKNRQIEFYERLGRVLVTKTFGQGALFAFEAAQ